MPATNDIAVLDIQVNTNAKQATTDLAGLQKQAGTTADSVKGLTDATKAQAPATTTAAGATKAFGAEMMTSHQATMAFRDTLHSIDPILRTAGASLGGVGQFAIAARAGIVGLGVALTGSLLVHLQNISDEAKKVQGDLAALGGSNAVGESAFAGLRAAADKTNLSLSTLSGAYGQLLIAQQKFQAAQGIIYAPGAAGATAALDKVIVALGSVGRVANETDATIAKVSNTLATSLATDGKIASAAFQQVVNDSPQMAAAIAKAFDGSTIVQFMQKVANGQVTYAKFVEALQRASAELETQSNTTAPNMTRAWNDLTNAIEKAAQALGKDFNLPSALQEVAKFINSLSKDTTTLYDIFQKMSVLNPFALIDYAVAQLFGTLGGLISRAQELWGWLQKIAGGAGGGPGGSMQNSLQPELAGQNPYSSTGGGVAPADVANFNLFNAGYTTSQIGALGGMPQDLAEGTYATVPSGYPDDSYRANLNLTEGERLIVVPKNKTLSDIIGGKRPIDLGRRASGADLGIGPGGSVSSSPIIDAAISPQGGAILSLVDKFSGVFSQVGDTMQDVKSVVSAAGNGKTNDVIRLSAIQTIGAISVSSNTLAQVISMGDSAIVSAISGLGSAISYMASARAVSSGGASVSGGSVASSGGGGGGGFRAAPGGGINNENDPFGISRVEKALGYSFAPAPTTASGSTYNQNAPAWVSSAADKAAQAAADKAATSGPPAFARSPGLSPTGSAYDPNDYGGSGGVADYGFAAAGADFVVPGSGGTDTVRLQGRVSPGEHVKITPRADVSGKGSGNSRTSPAIQNVTINLTAKDYASFVKSGSQLGQDARLMLDRALRHG